MHCISNGTACLIGKPMSVSSLPMTSIWHISESAVSFSVSSGCCKDWMSCWERLGNPLDIVRLRNCCTLVPNALTMWVGRPRACRISVRRLKSEVSVSDSLSLASANECDWWDADEAVVLAAGVAVVMVLVVVVVVGDDDEDDVDWFIMRAKLCLTVCAGFLAFVVFCFLVSIEAAADVDTTLVGATVLA